MAVLLEIGWRQSSAPLQQPHLQHHHHRRRRRRLFTILAQSCVSVFGRPNEIQQRKIRKTNVLRLRSGEELTPESQSGARVMKMALWLLLLCNKSFGKRDGFRYGSKSRPHQSPSFALWSQICRHHPHILTPGSHPPAVCHAFGRCQRVTTGPWQPRRHRGQALPGTGVAGKSNHGNRADFQKN